MIYFILSLLAVAIIAGLGLFSIAVLRVVRDQFDEMMPNRMVEYAGFIELPKN